MDAADTTLNVVVGHPLQLDLAVFRCWLQGFNVSEVFRALFAKGKPQDASGMDINVVHQYIRSQYRHFALLEPYLENPTSDDGKDQSILYQPLIPLTRELCGTLLESYYSFDDAVFREILGKKLNANLRRDMEDVSEKTNINVASCRRQFDNLKNIYKAMEEIEGKLMETIARNFLIPNDLALRYSVIIFTNYNRLDTSKKRLQSLSLADIEHCALLFMSWTDNDGTGCDLDPDFIRDLTEIRAFVTGYSDLLDEYRQLVVSFCESFGLQKLTQSSVKGMLRSVLQMGAGLKQEKEFRDIFIDIIEKIIDPLKKIGISADDANIFFKAIEEAYRQLRKLPGDFKERTIPSFSRYITGLKLAAHHLYDIV